MKNVFRCVVPVFMRESGEIAFTHGLSYTEIKRDGDDICVFDDFGFEHWIRSPGDPWHDDHFVVVDPVCADIPLLGIEDSSLSPAQRKHWEQMEAKQAAKEQLQRDAEAKSLKERAKQLSDAGSAMDRVNQDHGHKLGAMQCTHPGK